MYPKIPDAPHRYDDEPRMTYAHRVWRELVTGLPVFTLDEEQAEAALHASQMYVTAPEVAPAALNLYHAIRLQLHAQITRYRQEATGTGQEPRQDTTAPASPDQDGGQPARLPEPPTRPTPPASAAQPPRPAPTRQQLAEMF